MELMYICCCTSHARRKTGLALRVKSSASAWVINVRGRMLFHWHSSLPLNAGRNIRLLKQSPRLSPKQNHWPTSYLTFVIQSAAEITPTFWRSIKIKRNKVHKKFFYIWKAHMVQFFFQALLKITSLKCWPLLMTLSWSRLQNLSMALRVIAGGMAATSCRIASFTCSIVPGRRALEVLNK